MLSAFLQNPSAEERRTIIHRAINAHPYFYKLHFPVVAGIDNTPQYSQNVGVNRDFFLTDVQSNFNEVYWATGTYYNAQLSTNYRESLYRFDGKLPSAFLGYDTRKNTITNHFSDQQYEIKPLRVDRGDKIVGTVQNLGVKGGDTDLFIVLKGFALVSNPFITTREVEQINASLNTPVSFDYFSVKVTHDGREEYIIGNDYRPRVVLGFLVQDLQPIANNRTVFVSITDLARQLSLTDSKIPLEFIAPRIPAVKDSQAYFLPIEHYLPPLGRLQFTIDQTIPQGQTGGFRLSLLTRTI